MNGRKSNLNDGEGGVVHKGVSKAADLQGIFTPQMSKSNIIRWHNWCKEAMSGGSKTRSKEAAFNLMQDGI